MKHSQEQHFMIKRTFLKIIQKRLTTNGIVYRYILYMNSIQKQMYIINILIIKNRNKAI